MTTTTKTRTTTTKTTTNDNMKKNQNAIKMILKQYQEIQDRLTNIESILGEVQDTSISIEEEVYNQSNDFDNIDKKIELYMDNMTISSMQQMQLQNHAKSRVRELLGHELGEEYMLNHRKYFVKLWCNFREHFKLMNSWKELSPLHFKLAAEWIDKWEPVTN